MSASAYSEDALVERRGYWLLWTAYLVTQRHRKRKLEAEYRRSREP